MAVDVIMPKLGESITEGTIIEWKKNIIKYSDKILVIGNPEELKTISNEEKEIFINY